MLFSDGLDMPQIASKKIASKKQMRAQVEQKEKGFLQNRDRVGWAHPLSSFQKNK